MLEQARALIRKGLDHPGLLDRIADDEDLVAAGVNSGEMIRVALGCEDFLDRVLTDPELSRITSVRSVAELIGEVDPADGAPTASPNREGGA
jgi:acyl carrier protein